MADTPIENKEKQKKNDTPQQVSYDIDLSIPSIIAALHQKAIGSAEPKAKDVRIANSAIESDGKTAKLKSAGQHIISVLSTKQGEEAKVKKSDAIAVLQEYVNWFVGPDLGKKVNDDVVLPLGVGDENQQENTKDKDEDKDKKQQDQKKAEEEQNQTEENTEKKEEQKNESIKVKTFGEFLIENCGLKFLLEDDEKKNDEKEDINDQESDKNEKSNDEDKDDKNPSAPGWYIAYNLKVQGLKETPLKDAMKQFATSFFDELKIKASGIFGGADEFSGKDIRKGLHDLMHIDHEKLAENVGKYISKKFPNIEETEVKSRDKNTLLKELKTYLTPEQKEQINNAEYSLWIKVKEEDRKKPFLNTQKIADVIRKCMSFFRIGKKASITKDSIIKIENFKDEHDSQTLKNNAKRPSASSIEEVIKKDEYKPDNKGNIDYMKALKLYNSILKSFNGIEKDKKASEEKENKDALAILSKLKEQWKKQKEDQPVEKKIFDDFHKEYLKFETSTNESYNAFNIFNKKDITSMLLEMLFEETSDLIPQDILEADNDQENNEDDISVDKCSQTEEELKKQWKDIVKKYIKEQSCKISLLKKDDVINQLQYDDKNKLESEFNKNKELNYCLVIDFDKKSKIVENTTSEEIINMLFEQDLSSDEWKTVIPAHRDGKVKWPSITVDGKSREMNQEELRSALHDDTIEYKNGEFNLKSNEQIIKDIDQKQIQDQTLEIKNEIEQSEQQIDDDITKAFDDFKNIAKVDKNKNYGNLVILEKEVNIAESIHYDDLILIEDLLFEKSIYTDTGRKKKNDVIKEIKRVGYKTIKNAKNNLIKNLQTQKNKGIASAKNDKDEKRLVELFSMITKFFDELFKCNSTDEMVQLVEKMFDDEKTIGRTTQIWRVFDRAHLPDGEAESNEDGKDKVKITWYDADPESGKKEGNPLKELEIDKDTAVNDTEEAKKVFEELDKKLEDEKKEGYVFSGWNPTANTKVTKDTEIIAKYDKEKSTIQKKNYAVSFIALSNPVDPSSEKNIINVNGELVQVVAEGDKAIRPNENDIPKIDGYEFVDWGEAENKLDSVKEDIDAIANYKVAGGLIPVDENKVKCKAYLMPFAYYQNKDEGEEIEITFVAPKDPQKPEGDVDEIEKVKGKPGNINIPNDKIPQKEGYEFDKWDQDPQQIKETGQTVKALYKKKEDSNEDNGEEEKIPTSSEESGNNAGTDLYIYPIGSSKDFEEGMDDYNKNK